VRTYANLHAGGVILLERLARSTESSMLAASNGSNRTRLPPLGFSFSTMKKFEKYLNIEEKK
jgi:hypothetical protein